MGRCRPCAAGCTAADWRRGLPDTWQPLPECPGSASRTLDDHGPVEEQGRRRWVFAFSTKCRGRRLPGARWPRACAANARPSCDTVKLDHHVCGLCSILPFYPPRPPSPRSEMWLASRICVVRLYRCRSCFTLRLYFKIPRSGLPPRAKRRAGVRP